jgi:hypothetical protein
MRSIVRFSATLLFLVFTLWMIFAAGAEAGELVRQSFTIPGMPTGCF